ncbi:MAG TPA: hypothetical protein VKQ72_22535 [Aggregatilineales bacterium]|nr:hypothetical protein [Aggregatilineales bacterium]
MNNELTDRQQAIKLRLAGQLKISAGLYGARGPGTICGGATIAPACRCARPAGTAQPVLGVSGFCQSQWTPDLRPCPVIFIASWR